FKEFLQIFYLGKVHLTSENIVEVTNLCKSYEVAEGLKLCENVLQKLVTIENICSRFKLAIDLELINFIKFCEEEITRNTGAILKTADFLKCNRKTLEKLLELMPSSCCASVIVVDSCLTWAKSKCEQKNLEPTTAHLKAELGELIGLIPFAMMNAEQFAKFIIFHKGLLNDADLEGIVLKTMTEKDRIAVEKEQTVLENETLIEEVKILKLRLLAKSPKNDDDFDDGEWW
ncbi:uncharacterized protein LOC116346050, partial [Contarinia nasturtii]|uniref:uncharacterized protein LOC116346050 n=1 Tax=Contarinia nasturtii TaxID=265458 RepID=UPI0012D43061